MSENFENFNLDFSFGRVSKNSNSSGSVRKNQKININILSRKINNSLGKELFNEITEKENKVKQQLREIKKKTVEKDFERNMEGVGKGLLDDIKRTDDSILEIKKYKDFRFNKDENIYIPGIEKITQLKPVKIPDYLGFTKEEYYIEKYGKELSKYCREVLGLEFTMYETLENSQQIDNLESIEYTPELKTFYYREPYYLMLKSFRKGELDVNAFSRTISMKEDKKEKFDKKKDNRRDNKKYEKKGGDPRKNPKNPKRRKGKGKGKGEQQGNNIENLLKFILTIELEGDLSQVNKYLSIFKTLSSKFASKYQEKVKQDIKDWFDQEIIYDKFMDFYNHLKNKSSSIYDGKLDKVEYEKGKKLIDYPDFDNFKNGMIEVFKKIKDDEVYYKIMTDLEDNIKTIYDYDTKDYVPVFDFKQKVELKIPDDSDSDEAYECAFIFLYYLLNAYRIYYNPGKYNLKKAPTIMISATNRNAIMKLVLRGVEVYLFQLRKSFLNLVDFIKKELVSNKNKLLSENEKKKKEIDELKKIKNELNRKINEIKSEDKKKRLIGIREKIEEKIKKIEK